MGVVTARLVGAALLMASLGTWVGAALATTATPCTRHCACAHTNPPKQQVKASSILEQIRRGEPTSLSNVLIVGDLDFEQVPLTPVGDKAASALPGLQAPRTELNLIQLERDLAVPVTHVRLVPARISIEKSVLHGSIKTGNAKSPMVFLSSFILRDTIVCGDTDLSQTRFRNPVILDGSTFKGSTSLRHAVFGDNALLQGVHLAGKAVFADARFERAALLINLVAVDPAGLSFARARFLAGVDFHSKKPGRTNVVGLSLDNAEVTGLANFQNTDLRDPNFAKTRFKGRSEFSGAVFSGGRATFTATEFYGNATFDEAEFKKGATFYTAEFLNGPVISFDRAKLFGPMDFTQARLTGPISFVQAESSDLITFVDAELRANLDLRRAHVPALMLGGGAARAQIGGEAAFDNAFIGKALLEGTDFVGKVTFVSTTFGWKQSCRPGQDSGRVVVSLSNSSFGSTADFTDAVFDGEATLSHLRFEAGKVRLRWAQVAGALSVESVGALRKIAGSNTCFALDTAAEDPVEAARRRVEMLRVVERNFKAHELLDDSNSASYVRQLAEAQQDAADTRRSWADRWLSAARLYVFGYVGGFGLRPLWILVEIMIWILVGGLAYRWSGRPLGCDPPSDTPVDWKLIALPIRDSPTFAASQGVSRATLAAWVSVAAATTIRVRGAHIGLSATDRMRWVVYVQRGVGYLLMIVLGVSVASTMPILHKTFSWLPGF